jgi:hypothetical protein
MPGIYYHSKPDSAELPILLPAANGQTLECSKSIAIAHHLQNNWGSQLSALGELPFLTARKPNPKDSFYFRFVCLPSFLHPMCVRIEHRKDGATMLYAKVTSGTGGYSPGKRFIDRRLIVSAETYAELIEKINSTKFFEQPEDQDNDDMDDGSQWVLEANDGARYHIVNTVGGGTLREIGVFLLKAGDILPSKTGY